MPTNKSSTDLDPRWQGKIKEIRYRDGIFKRKKKYNKYLVCRS